MLDVAVLVDSSLQYDRRALLELETLSQLPIKLTVYCNEHEGRPAADTLNGIKLNRVFNDSYWKWKNTGLLAAFANDLVKSNHDILHCHDNHMLEIGGRVKRLKPTTVLIYESRELFYSYPINFFNESFFTSIKSKLVRRLQVMREKANMRLADWVIAVNESIAGLLQERFRLKHKPIVVRNTGPLRIPVNNSLLRNELGIGLDKKIVVYIGSNVYPKMLQLEKLIDQINSIPTHVLVIIATSNIRRQWFKSYVKQRDISNVYFHDMIPVEQVETYLAGCDVGVVSAWNKKNLSYWHALDNKLFSYIMSGIPVLATAQPEYRNIVERYKVGVCINPEEHDAFANGLRQIEKYENEFRRNAESARLELNWDKEKRALVDLYNTLAASH